MKDFLKPTQARLIVTLVLSVYVFLSVSVLASFNTPRNSTHIQITTLDQVAIVLSYFGALLNIPFFYVTSLVHWLVGLIVEFLVLYSIAPFMIRLRNYLTLKIKNH